MADITVTTGKFLSLTGLQHYDSKLKTWVTGKINDINSSISDIATIRNQAAKAYGAWEAFLAGWPTTTVAPTLNQLAVLNGDEATEGSVKYQIAAALGTAKGYADATLADAKTYADGKVSKALEDAIAHADGLAVNYDAAGSAAAAETAAKAYTDSKVDGKFDAVGSAAQALTDAKAYTDSKVDGKFDAVGSAAQALTDAKAYTDGKDTAMDTRVKVLEAIDHDAYKAADTALETSLKAYADTAEADAISAAKTYADGLNTAMDARVVALEAIDHDHANKAELDKIAEGDVAKWDKAVADLNDFLTGTDTDNVVNKLSDIKAWMEGAGADVTDLSEAIAAEAKSREDADKAINDKIGTVTEDKTVVEMIGDAEAAAKSYADGLAVNYDAAGSAAAAEAAAKSYADGLAVNYDAAGSASAAETAAKAYAKDLVMDGETPRFDAKGAAATAESNAKAYADGLAKNYDASGSAAQALVDAKDYTDTEVAKCVKTADFITNSDIDALFV